MTETDTTTIDSPLEKLLTIEEVSEVTHLAVQTLRNMISRRAIPYVKLGSRVRFRPSEINRWILDHSVGVA